MAVSYSDDRILGVGVHVRVYVGGGGEDVSVEIFVPSTLLSSGKGLSMLYVTLLPICFGCSWDN